MSDLEVIKELERILSQNKGMKIELHSEDKKKQWKTKSYTFENENVIEISLYDCNIENIEEIVSICTKLKELTGLYLMKNKITDIKPLAKLKKITTLVLSENRINDITPLLSLTQLNTLFITYNEISNIDLFFNSPDIIKNLNMIHLGRNKIVILPKTITESKLDIKWDWQENSNAIFLQDNPIEIPPVEIIKQGKEAIKKYFTESLLLATVVGKITNINIKNLNQFHDLSLDLTIPNGHKNQGKAFEKVCFIGQSGTGKTTLLNIIRFFANASESVSNVEIPNIENAEIEIHYLLQNNVKISITYKDKMFGSQIIENFDNQSFESIVEFLYESKKQQLSTIYFPDVIKNINIMSVWETINEVLHKYDASFAERIENQVQQNLKKNEGKGTRFLYSPHHTEHNLAMVWEEILAEINQFNESFANKTMEYAKLLLKNPHSVNEENIKFQKWLNEHTNPLKELADNCLDQLLNKFGIRVKTEIENVSEIPFIILETFDGQSIPLENWSSGTKQIIFRALPLYWLKPENTTILFDEVENSLYPDIQKLVVDFYTSLGENCQYFFSTHSPVIASSFEGYEIVKLKFDKEGKYIETEKFYEGERNVDNYFLNPRLLRWDGIYQRIMDLETEGGDERRKLMPKAARLRKQLETMQEEQKQDTPEYQAKANEYIKMAKKLGWEV